MTAQEKALESMKKAKVPGTFKGLKSKQVKDIFELYKPQIAQALPKHLTAERVIQMATTLISRTPELAECTTESLLGAVMQASILGFEPVHALGQCWFVPFWNSKKKAKEVQFIIGYKGMLDLARRSGQIQTVYSQPVYENDEFEYEFGLEPKLIHKPALENRGKLTHVYAVAKFVNGGFAFEVMSKADVDKIKAKSQAAKSEFSPWNTNYDEMARKTVIRRLFKYLPISIEIQKSVATDETILQPEYFRKESDDQVEVDLDAVEVPETAEEAEIVEEKPKEKPETQRSNVKDLFDSQEK